MKRNVVKILLIATVVATLLGLVVNASNEPPEPKTIVLQK